MESSGRDSSCNWWNQRTRVRTTYITLLTSSSICCRQRVFILNKLSIIELAIVVEISSSMSADVIELALSLHGC